MQALGGVAAERALAVQHHELPQPVRRRQTERAQHLRPGSARWRIGEPPRRQPARRDDPDQASPIAAPIAQRQQARGRRPDQRLVVERAVGPRDALEALIGCAERMRQRRKIGLFGHRVRTNQHALRPNTERLRAAFRGGGDAAGQDVANTVDFGADARARRGQRKMPVLRQCRPQRLAIEPNLRIGAANGRSRNATKRHRWPPDAT